MGTCSTCGNEYDKTFAVETADGTHLTFDSIECAAHLIAPACAHCDCRILGHGTEAAGTMYCCASCAQQAGAAEARDRL